MEKISNTTKIIFIIIHFILAFLMALCAYQEFSSRLYLLAIIEVIMVISNIGVSICWITFLK